MTAGRRHLAPLVAALALAQVLAFGARAALASTPEHPASAPPNSAAAPAPQAQPQPEPTKITPTPSPAGPIALSNERTATTWAHPVEEVGIRARPLVSSRTIGRTHLATEDGFPDTYLLLSRLTDARGRVWVRIRIPGRPNGRTGWVTRDALGELHVTHWMIVISLGGRRLRAYNKGRLRFTAPVGVGKPSTPTPTGHFWIRELFRITDRSNLYYPYAIGTSAYSTLTDWPGGGVVGIHGDLGQPQLVPGAPSHGCVRMHAADVSWLAQRVQLGTPVHIVR
jgi:L,D-transpeptidase catalytic domain